MQVHGLQQKGQDTESERHGRGDTKPADCLLDKAHPSGEQESCEYRHSSQACGAVRGSEQDLGKPLERDELPPLHSVGEYIYPRYGPVFQDEAADTNVPTGVTVASE